MIIDRYDGTLTRFEHLFHGKGAEGNRIKSSEDSTEPAQNMSLLNKSALASTRFFDGNGLHLRVYYQYTSDNVKESFYDATIGWNLRGDGSVINAKVNTPLAVVSWASGTQVRATFGDALQV